MPIIKLKSQDAANGFFIIATNGQAYRLSNNTFVVGKKHLELLEEAGISYQKINNVLG